MLLISFIFHTIWNMNGLIHKAVFKWLLSNRNDSQKVTVRRVGSSTEAR